jgi:AcrR family transcriptional regulator
MATPAKRPVQRAAKKGVPAKGGTKKKVATKPVRNRPVAKKRVARDSVTEKRVARKRVATKPVRNRPVAEKGVGKKRVARPNRAEKKQDTEQRIVAAALGLFQTRGFDATTTKAIAREAGIAEGTVFNYFRTKDDIALHFFEQEVEHAVSAVRGNARLSRAPLEEKLFALIQRQLEYLEPYERFIGSALVEALKPSSRLGVFGHRAQALRHRYIGYVEDMMEDALPARQFRLMRLWAPDAFWVFYMATLLFWLYDDSDGKQKTLAFLDRSLKVGVSMLGQSR